MLHLPSLSASVQEYMYSEFRAVYDRKGYLLWRVHGSFWKSFAQDNQEGAFNLILVPGNFVIDSQSPFDYDDCPVRTHRGIVIANDLPYEFRIVIYAFPGDFGPPVTALDSL